MSDSLDQDLPGTHPQHQLSKHPVVVLLHGFPLNARMWDMVLAHLGSGLSVFAPDLPGFGACPPLANQGEYNATIGDYAEAVEKMIEAEGVSSPFVLGGLSMGGYIALEFAARYPQRLSRLILCDTKTEADTLPARQVRLRMAEKLIRVAELPASCDPVADPRAAIAEKMLPNLLSPKTAARHGEIVEQVRTMIMDTEMLAIATAQRAMAHRRDTRDVVRSAPFPIDCIVGEHDTLTSPQAMQGIADAAARGRTWVIPDAGHLPPIEQPVRFASILRACVLGTE